MESFLRGGKKEKRMFFFSFSYAHLGLAYYPTCGSKKKKWRDDLVLLIAYYTLGTVMYCFPTLRQHTMFPVRFVREMHSRPREWLEIGSENGGIMPALCRAMASCLVAPSPRARSSFPATFACTRCTRCMHYTSCPTNCHNQFSLRIHIPKPTKLHNMYMYVCMYVCMYRFHFRWTIRLSFLGAVSSLKEINGWWAFSFSIQLH